VTGVRIVPGAVHDRDEIESVIATFAREPNGGLLVPPDAITLVHQQLILRLAARHRLPAVYPYRAWAVNGGLLSYGIDVVDQGPLIGVNRSLLLRAVMRAVDRSGPSATAHSIARATMLNCELDRSPH
jgi:hypothetical protein